MRIVPLLVATFVGCGASQVTPPAPATAPAPAPLPSPSASSSAPPSVVSSASAPASASVEPPAPKADPALLGPATEAPNVAVVHVRSHRVLVSPVDKSKHLAVTLDVLRWLKGPADHPVSLELRIDPSTDPPLGDDLIYLVAFRAAFQGKALPDPMHPTLVREMSENDPKINELAAALGTPPRTAIEICRRTFFEFGSFPSQCSKIGSAEATPKAFEAHIEVTTPKVKGGDTIEYRLELVNTSKDDAVLRFQPSCAKFEPLAFKNGKRVDFVNEFCGYGGGCGGTAVHLVIPPAASSRQN